MRLETIYDRVQKDLDKNKELSKKSRKDVPQVLEVKKGHTYIYSVNYGKGILFCVNSRKKNDTEYKYFIELLVNHFNGKSVSNIDNGDEYNIRKNLSNYTCKIILL